MFFGSQDFFFFEGNGRGVNLGERGCWRELGEVERVETVVGCIVGEKNLKQKIKTSMIFSY